MFGFHPLFSGLSPCAAIRVCRGLALVGGVFWGGAAGALDVSVLVSPRSENLSEALAARSLVSQLTQTDAPETLDILASAQADYRRVLALLYERGYFGATVSIKLDGQEASNLSTLSPPAQISKAAISVAIGPRFAFGRTSIAPRAPDSLPSDDFATGKRASTKVLQEAVSGAIDDWRHAGHAKASPSQQVFTVSHDKNLLNAEVKLAPGARARFGAVTVTGNKDVRAERVVEILGIGQGGVFTPADLSRAEIRLRRTDAFRSVVLKEADEIAPDGTLAIEAQVEEKVPRRVGFGGEISSNEGATVSAYWLHRNFWGGAERVRVSGEISGIGSATGRSEYDFTVRYARPATYSPDMDVFVIGEALKRTEESYSLEQLMFGAGVRRYVTEEYEYRFSANIARSRERDVFGRDEYNLLTLEYDGIFDYRDDALRPTKGYLILPNLVPFTSFDGARRGLRGFVDARKYYALGQDSNTVFALRGQLGTIFGASLADTPADFLFYSGGTETVRGFPFQSLGIDVGSDLVGGRSFVGASAELRTMRDNGLGFVGFVDAGYISANSFVEGNGKWHAGGGVGIRYDTGIGPLRFDVAMPIAGSEDGDGVQLYIGIGEAF